MTRYVAPLFQFPWEGGERKIAADLSIVDQEKIHLSFDTYSRPLGEVDQGWCRAEPLWLELNHAAQDVLKPSEIMNLFLLCLWTVKPTKTFLAYRFQPDLGEVCRLRDRFTWVDIPADVRISDADLQKTSEYFSIAREIVLSSDRVKTALGFTLLGCWTNDWKLGLVCFSTAVEALLVYRRGRGLTKRLKDACACAAGTCIEEREKLQAQFEYLYGLRSDIVHEGAYHRDDPEKNIKDLAAFSDLLRRLWARVFTDMEFRVAVAGDNQTREAFFRKTSTIQSQTVHPSTGSGRTVKLKGKRM